MLLTIDECRSKIARNCVFYCHLSATDNKKTLFLTIFDLQLSIILMLLILSGVMLVP